MELPQVQVAEPNEINPFHQSSPSSPWLDTRKGCPYKIRQSVGRRRSG